MSVEVRLDSIINREAISPATVGFVFSKDMNLTQPLQGDLPREKTGNFLITETALKYKLMGFYFGSIKTGGWCHNVGNLLWEQRVS